MIRTLKERDRLLAFSARCVGLVTTFVALLCLSLPLSIESDRYPITVGILVLLGICQLRLRSAALFPWLVATIVVGLAAIIVVGLSSGDNPAALSALAALASGSVACVAVLLVTTVRRIILLAVTFLVTVSAICAVTAGNAPVTSSLVILAVFGWAICTATGAWLTRAIPRVMRRIFSMSRAYRAERQASEAEAHRRQSARLLHDTVLATLTLLAHSGVGVGADALREQAGEDAALLRQLRLGATPTPRSSGEYALAPVEESTLGNTLESVKQRFRRMGLEVNWHGTGQVLLPGDTLDAFLLALAECLENVRRHSGMTEANVTITEDDATVRAMVTDSGVGFDLGEVDSEHLGFTESIVARLRDVGGNARLFSSPGAGTTVVLEVPR